MSQLPHAAQDARIRCKKVTKSDARVERFSDKKFVQSGRAAPKSAPPCPLGSKRFLTERTELLSVLCARALLVTEDTEKNRRARTRSQEIALQSGVAGGCLPCERQGDGICLPKLLSLTEMLERGVKSSGEGNPVRSQPF